MRTLLALLCAVLSVACAQSTVITGRVVDRADRGVAHARIEAFHWVPLIEFPDPQNPPWNGLLGRAYSARGGYFKLEVSDRASLDYLMAFGGGHRGYLRSPAVAPVRIVLDQKVLSPEGEYQRAMKKLRKRLRQQTPNQAMERTATSRAFTSSVTSAPRLRATPSLGGRRSSFSR